MENALVPPRYPVAVAVGVVALLVIRVLMFHMVTRFAPAVLPCCPAPTNRRSLVPSNSSSNGEQAPAGLVALFTWTSLNIAGVAFRTPRLLNVSVYKPGLVPANV